MRVVIDASIDPRLVEAFRDHHVQTLFDLGWQHLKDPVLAKQLECDVLITADRGFEHEHNLKSLPFGIAIVHVTRNKITFYRPLFPQLLNAVATIRAGEVVHVYGPPAAKPEVSSQLPRHERTLARNLKYMRRRNVAEPRPKW